MQFPRRWQAKLSERRRAVDAPLFTLGQLDLRFEPYPHGVAAPLFADHVYQQLVSAFPPRELFGKNPINVKYVLSERVNGREYARFLRGSPIWRQFARWVRSDAFISCVLHELRTRHVDLGYRQRPGLQRLIRRLAYGLGGRRDFHSSLFSRFEFSMLPADGGMVLPHTDSPGKIVTMILPMVAEGEWHPGLGGDTDINTPRADHLRFNGVNGKADFADMDIASSLAFQPNRALLFIRTYNSWHSVRPMTASGSSALRRTVTVTILER